jgi:hypothetical protein
MSSVTQSLKSRRKVCTLEGMLAEIAMRENLLFQMIDRNPHLSSREIDSKIESMENDLHQINSEIECFFQPVTSPTTT